MLLFVACPLLLLFFTSLPHPFQVLTSEGDAASNKLIRDHYPWLYRTFQKAKMDTSAKMAGDVIQPSMAVVDAFMNPYPKTRYPCTNVGGMPARFVLLLKTVLPDRAYDFIMR